MSPQEISIVDLQLSVRTSDYVESLGVKTLAELLAVPRLVVKRLMARELEEIFTEQGVEFAGELVIDEAVAMAIAGDVVARWNAIAAWLSEHHAHELKSFRSPATPEAIALGEKALGRTLPDDYKRFLALHDGQEDGGAMVGTCSLFPVEVLAEKHAWLSTLIDPSAEVDEEGVGPGVRPVEYVAGWIPIGESARGRDYLCIDLDPADGGTSGQIIKLAVDSNDRPLIAKSFTELLSVFFTGLQTGDVTVGDIEDPS
jgi:cell wall assembly regulator SMI1